MRQETERCRKALELAQSGETVALVSSGDPGIYGMAGLALELAAADGLPVPIEVIPGITAASAAAARLGAPLMLDYAVISLSDLLVPWETIRKRIEAVAAADLVTVLYNPRSKKRVKQLEEALVIVCRPPPRDHAGGHRNRGGHGRRADRLDRSGSSPGEGNRHAQPADHRQPLLQKSPGLVHHAEGI